MKSKFSIGMVERNCIFLILTVLNKPTLHEILFYSPFCALIAIQSRAQDPANVLGAFKTAELPYEFPEGATSTFGDEEFESPYPVVDIDVFNRATGAELPLETQLFGVHKMKFDNFYLLVLLEISININNGMENHSFVYCTLNDDGEMIDSRYACTYSVYDNFQSFLVTETSVKIARGEYAGEEDLLIVEMTEEEDVLNTEGAHGMRRVTITTTYNAIDVNGKISNITSPL